jgi:putative tricarboxylic transport membrane protein
MSKQANVPTLCVAGFMLVASLVLAFFFILPPGGAVEAQGVAPDTWPKAMLLCLAVCAFVVLARELSRYFGARPTSAETPHPESAYDNRRAAIGIALLIAYGIAVPFAGFALSTVVFLAVWLVCGGLRKPLTVALLSVIGTVSLLYVFAGLSKMPLDRGAGVFDGLTIALYRLLGIY